MSKKVLIALPPAMLELVDFAARCEHRTRSDLIRESLRRYLDSFRRSQGIAITLPQVEPSETALKLLPAPAPAVDVPAAPTPAQVKAAATRAPVATHVPYRISNIVEPIRDVGFRTVQLEPAHLGEV